MADKRVTKSKVSAPKVSRSAPRIVAEAGAFNVADVGDVDRVARRAYELFIERGGQHGRDVEDWLRAEAEVSAGR
jgi:hypothetical protein